MRTLTCFVACLVLWVASAAADHKSLDEHQIEVWTGFVSAEIKVGSSQAAVDKILVPKSVDQITADLGGTGHYFRYYAIDDFIMIGASFDRFHKLLSIPWVVPRKKFRRYPDGRASPEIEVSPDGALVYP